MAMDFLDIISYAIFWTIIGMGIISTTMSITLKLKKNTGKEYRLFSAIAFGSLSLIFGFFTYISTTILDYEPHPTCWECPNIPVTLPAEYTIFCGAATAVSLTICIYNIVKYLNANSFKKKL